MPSTKMTARQKDKLIEAAQNAISFTVRGSGPFPFDMLRYDRCWPASEFASSFVTGMGAPGERHVAMQGLKDPTTARWASYGWTVVLP